MSVGHEILWSMKFQFGACTLAEFQYNDNKVERERKLLRRESTCNVGAFTRLKIKDFSHKFVLTSKFTS